MLFSGTCATLVSDGACSLWLFLSCQLNDLEVELLRRLAYTLRVSPDEFDRYHSELLTHAAHLEGASPAAPVPAASPPLKSANRGRGYSDFVGSGGATMPQSVPETGPRTPASQAAPPATDCRGAVAAGMGEGGRGGSDGHDGGERTPQDHDRWFGGGLGSFLPALIPQKTVS